MTRPPLLFLGYANVDLTASVPRHPKIGERVTALPIEVFPGGMAANAACTAATLGGDVFFFGNVGQDDYGKLLIEDFKRCAVNLDHVTVVKRTTVGLITVTPEGERTIISEPFDYHPEKLRQWLESYQGAPGFFYVDGYHLCAAKPELEMAKIKGFTLYCDLDGALDTYTFEEVFETLKGVDILQVTHDLLFKLAEQGMKLETLRAILPTVIVTNGGKRVTVYSIGVQEFPVPNVHLVDSTGAGDCFAGSLLATYRVARNLPLALETAIQHASALVQIRGTRLP
jgi:sugar/nucleoside kinase (ribokinase family)